ncbi:GatB/YqeY domain-containing protein [Acetobacter sp. AN02]|nr:GatB/YqeY domain-containing protein [Acetobacter sp. AN02]MDG6095295.1 GatB/YqeY domain-containing protein [Acetobacter sp. AN02]
MSDASLRTRFTDDLKTAMKSGEKDRVALLRMIGAKLKETDIAARAKGVEQVGGDEIVSMLRGMAKSRAESAHLYREGGRPELAEKEEAEIAIIRDYLPAEMDDAALGAEIEAVIAATGASSMKDMGKVMGALKAKFGASLDLGRANAVLKARLAG